MKKRIFMLLMAMMMLLGMSLTVFANESVDYEGMVSVELYGTESIAEELSVSGTYTNGVMSGEFTTSNGHNFKWTCDTETNYAEVIIDDNYTDDYGGGGFGSNGDFSIGMKCTNSDILFGFWFEMTLSPSTNQASHQIATAVSGSTVSDSGNYMVTVAGYLTAELTNGTHTLSASHIASQSISVIVVNTSNGVVNILNQSSIDEITVTVSGGVATQVAISGTAQTAGGSSDTYTVTINP